VSAIVTDNHLLTAALDLAGHGMHVFPLKPGSKVPALTHDWEARATTDPARIERCWRAGAFNIGVACGPSGLYVVDLDTPKPDTPAPEPPFDEPGIRTGADALAHLALLNAEPYPGEVMTVITGRGGEHLYFRQPEGAALRNTAGKLGYLIDTRGAGGYVVGPGSEVNGKPYRAAFLAEPAPLPAWIRRLIDPPKRPTPTGPPPRFHAPGKYADTVLSGELAKVLTAKTGTRNDTVNRVAFTLGKHIARGTLPADLVERTLIAAALRTGLSEAEAKRAIGSGLTAGKLKGGAAQ
jgi:hypothetical protein